MKKLEISMQFFTESEQFIKIIRIDQNILLSITGEPISYLDKNDAEQLIKALQMAITHMERVEK